MNKNFYLLFSIWNENENKPNEKMFFYVNELNKSHYNNRKLFTLKEEKMKKNEKNNK